LNEIRGDNHSDQSLEGLASLLPTQVFMENDRLRYRISSLLRPMLERRFDGLDRARRKAIATTAFNRSVALGRTLDALNFALVSGTAQKAVALLEDIGPLRLMMMYGVDPVQDILRRVPLPLLATAFRSRLAMPISYAKRGCLVEARRMVKAAVADIAASELSGSAKQRAMRDAMFARIQIAACSESSWVQDLDQAVQTELAEDSAFAAWNRACMGIISHQMGRLSEAEDHFFQSEMACRQIGAAYQLDHLRLHRAHVDLARGHLRSAIRTLRDVSAHARIAYPADLGFQAVAEIARIEASLLTSRSSVPLDALSAAFVKLRQGDGWYEPFASGLLSIARCLFKERGIDGVLDGLKTIEGDLHRAGIMHVNDAITALRAYYLALTGRTHLSESLLGATKGVTDTQPRATRFWRERLLTGIAAALNESAHGHHAQAQAIADAILADSQQDGRMVAVAEAHLVRAFVLARCPTGQTQALAPLVAGLNLIGMHAIPGLLHEWRELVKDHAEALRGLLDPAAHVLLERIEREWGGRVQKDLLSDREVSVLRGVAAGLTNKHISRECGLSVNTIKFHLKQCFRKLDVQTREGAVETARQAGLF
jgi:LuxR family maltose regulon positive regulatory protein